LEVAEEHRRLTSSWPHRRLGAAVADSEVLLNYIILVHGGEAVSDSSMTSASAMSIASRVNASLVSDAHGERMTGFISHAVDRLDQGFSLKVKSVSAPMVQRGVLALPGVAGGIASWAIWLTSMVCTCLCIGLLVLYLWRCRKKDSELQGRLRRSNQMDLEAVEAEDGIGDAATGISIEPAAAAAAAGHDTGVGAASAIAADEGKWPAASAEAEEGDTAAAAAEEEEEKGEEASSPEPHLQPQQTSMLDSIRNLWTFLDCTSSGPREAGYAPATQVDGPDIDGDDDADAADATSLHPGGAGDNAAEAAAALEGTDGVHGDFSDPGATSPPPASWHPKDHDHNEAGGSPAAFSAVTPATLSHAPAEVTADEGLSATQADDVSSLVMMGFDRDAVIRALRAKGWNQMEAMEALIAGEEIASVDAAPAALAASAPPVSGLSPEKEQAVRDLCDFGFPREDVIAALEAADWKQEVAANHLLGTGG